MHKPLDPVDASGIAATNGSLSPTVAARTEPNTGGYAGYIIPTPYTWQEDAGRDRDRAIGILKDARQRATELFVLVDSYDVRLSGELASFRRKLDERLAMCLLAREDAGA